MLKVFESFGERKGISVSSYRFLLDGEKIHGDSTPQELELEDHDVIDVVVEQVRVCGPSVTTYVHGKDLAVSTSRTNSLLLSLPGFGHGDGHHRAFGTLRFILDPGALTLLLRFHNLRAALDCIPTR